MFNKTQDWLAAMAVVLIHSAPAQAQMVPVRMVQGIPLYQEEMWVGGNRIPVSILTLSPSAGRLRPIWAEPTGLVGLRELSSFASEQGALAAINGGFFNRNTRQPLGTIRLDGRWISSPILGRGVVAWSDQGKDSVPLTRKVRFGRLRMQAELRNGIGDRIPLMGINTGYIVAGISQFTSDWGSTYTTQTDNETVLQVQEGQVQAILSAGLAGSVSVPIPVGGYVLAARELEGSLEAQKLVVGDRLSIHLALDPPELEAYPHLLGAGPLLLLDGQVVLDAEREQFQPAFRTQRAARSAIGLLESGHLLWVTAGNAQENQGITLQEMAQLMLQLGCRHALNLDGGNSSTTLVLEGEAVNWERPFLEVSNPENPADSGLPRRLLPRVHNGLGFFPL
ncbi:phosphodiester glycosidase family protein [Synechococcus sp. Nb3U1]|uniref:phosphodiester glycosidase family protein n=1 Tax=Synechococcus sp. Nb3U1 TaxID=1914529 RepID=UPI001F2CEECC|nr:phosphodiester glycosidase family protein [Synechococcus sp. Nb3U1]MCF2970208.1 phosphodiester glycosidase family protein [Synechococcus sp. Nb3U1]